MKERPTDVVVSEYRLSVERVAHLERELEREKDQVDRLIWELNKNRPMSEVAKLLGESQKNLHQAVDRHRVESGKRPPIYR